MITSHLLLLQLLLYMDFGGTLVSDYTTQHCYAQKSGCAIRSCNRVCNRAGLQAVEVAQIKQFFGVTPFTWVVDAHDKQTREMLQANGLQYIAQFPAMHADISVLSDVIYEPDITIKRVYTQEDFALWAYIPSVCYGYASSELLKMITLFTQRGGDAFRVYVGFYKDIPCAASMTVLHEDVVTIHLVGVLPEFRSRGLGYAITHRPLHDACIDGCTRALLMATKMGQSLYKRFGFEEYARYDVYAIC